VDHSVDRVLDLLGVPAEDARRWDGRKSTTAVEPKRKPRARTTK
jgi:hypothetical protein